ncbi:phosphoribosyl-AMP cyclohydrolase [Sphingobium sp. TA15]|uniref:Histidine biosynthesis bifunctional protein HisIE n=1 Tax=Sphingobium indicum (strain DSM 16413 / CCM 7287 / MTCC 6362 / UT26 / NBRC 101211 / UT26S) TaxID=452662 RepID=D4Z2A5_SPHIU|nr:phosphoribosyl-AMP cyclohydrolase [Sphingobium indicum UT26S]BDD66172.1 phosphoribosyl-AMP cyclohydrolase [Sphingobium sp. TA15]
MNASSCAFFAERCSIEQVELGDELAPRFDRAGLLPAIVVDATTGQVLMLGYMNAEAFARTLHSREVHFWSRSRQAIWRKGEHSGFTQSVERVLVDDDQDALVVHARVNGPGSCHVGFRSCFYREIDLDTIAGTNPVHLRQIEPNSAFDAAAVYAGLPNPTRV